MHDKDIREWVSEWCYKPDPHVLELKWYWRHWPINTCLFLVPRRYDNFHIGTFVLYKSTIRLFEVHVRQWECASITAHPTSCVCGFAARDGTEVISFDMCNGLSGETKPRLVVKNGDLAKSSIRITESYQGRKVTVRHCYLNEMIK